MAHSEKNVFETERLVLRPFTEADVDEIYSLVYADARVREAWSGYRGTAGTEGAVRVSDRDRAGLFDDWADGYDRSVQSSTGLFEGYQQILDQVVRSAAVHSGLQVLDLGVGTGNLARRFVALGCEVWGIDFSRAMLNKARAKIPQTNLVQMDLLQDAWPSDLEQRQFDRIVSTYVFHEFDLATKVRLLQRLAHEHLSAGGWIVVGDVAFPSLQALRQAGADHWDPDEHYWVADQAISALQAAGFQATYTQVSHCGGVMVIEGRGIGTR